MFVSLNPITPMFSYNRGHTEGITADSCVIWTGVQQESFLSKYWPINNKVVLQIVVLTLLTYLRRLVMLVFPNFVLVLYNATPWQHKVDWVEWYTFA